MFEIERLWAQFRTLLNAGQERTGRSQEFVPTGAGEDRPRDLLTNDGNPDQAAECYTLSISVERVGDIPDRSDAVARMRLKYGNGGHSEYVDFDLGAGVVLTVPTKAIALQVLYTGNIGPKLRIGAHLAPGTHAGESRVRLSQRASVVNAGSAIKSVPARASGLLALTSDPGGAVQADFLAADPAVGTIYTATFTPGLAGDIFAVPTLAGVAAVQLTNLGGAPALLTWVWEINL